MGRTTPLKPNDNKAWSHVDNTELIKLYRAARHHRDARENHKKINWKWVAKRLERSSALSCQQQYNKICNDKIPGVQLPEDLRLLFKGRRRGPRSPVSGFRRSSSLLPTQSTSHAGDLESNLNTQYSENMIDVFHHTGRAPNAAQALSSHSGDYISVEDIHRIQAEAELAMESDDPYHDNCSSESSFEASAKGRYDHDDDDVDISPQSGAVMRGHNTPATGYNIAPVPTSPGNDAPMPNTPIAKQQGKDAATAVIMNIFRNTGQPSRTVGPVGHATSQACLRQHSDIEEANQDLSQMSLASPKSPQGPGILKPSVHEGTAYKEPSAFDMTVDHWPLDKERSPPTCATNATYWSSNTIAPVAPMVFPQLLTHLQEGSSRPYEPSATVQHPPPYYNDAKKNKWYWNAWLAEAQDNCKISLELRKLTNPDDARRQYEKVCLAKSQLQEQRVKLVNEKAQWSLRSPSVVSAASSASNEARTNKRPQSFGSTLYPNKRSSPPRQSRESTVKDGEIRE